MAFRPTTKRTMVQYIAANVRALRLARELTHEQLAEAAEIDPSFLARVERAETNPTVAILVKLGNALEVAPARLFDRAEMKPNRPGRPRKPAR